MLDVDISVDTDLKGNKEQKSDTDSVLGLQSTSGAIIETYEASIIILEIGWHAELLRWSIV